MTKVMQRVILSMVFLAAVMGTKAEDYRQWTEAETKRQIEAKIVDKKLDDSEAELVMRNGTSVWMKKDRLIAEDQKYIENWVKPVDHITARVVGSGQGWKKVEVTAVAGSKPLVVKAFWRGWGRQPRGYPKVYKLKKGETKTFTYRGGNKYVVRGFYGNEKVDEESWDSKSGL